MRMLTAIFAALLLPLLSHAAKKTPAEIYNKYRAKSLSSPLIPLSDSSFDEITAIPRSHAVVVFLTALSPEMKCKLCRDMQPEFQILAKSWAKGDKDGASETLIGSLDFLQGRKTFESLMLQTAPIVMLFPPTTGPHAAADPKPITLDFAMGPQGAEQLHMWISRNLPASVPKPAFRRPFNYMRFLVISFLAVAAFTALSLLWPVIAPVLQNRNLWAVLCILAVLLFTSGHMFNQIRGTPYIAVGPDGRVSYLAGGFQNQYGLESQLVGAIYAVLALSTLGLSLQAPRIKDPRAQRVTVFIWGAVMLGAYSLLLSIFRAKQGGYPFWLPPF